MITPELTTGLLTLAGAIVGALPGMISGFFNRKAEEKKQLRELVMKTTAETWRFIAENAKAVLPFEHYMIHTTMMCDLAFSGKEITEEVVTAHLAKVATIMGALHKHALTQTPKRSAA